MDVIRRIQVAVVRADIILTHARAAFPGAILIAALIAAAILIAKRRTHK